MFIYSQVGFATRTRTWENATDNVSYYSVPGIDYRVILLPSTHNICWLLYVAGFVILTLVYVSLGNINIIFYMIY